MTSLMGSELAENWSKIIFQLSSDAADTLPPLSGLFGNDPTKVEDCHCSIVLTLFLLFQTVI